MDQKTNFAFVVGLIVGAILYHFFMGRQMREQQEVQRFGRCREGEEPPLQCTSKCEKDSGLFGNNWKKIERRCKDRDGTYKKCSDGNGRQCVDFFNPNWTKGVCDGKCPSL
jgi:hypothetical protein